MRWLERKSCWSSLELRQLLYSRWQTIVMGAIDWVFFAFAWDVLRHDCIMLRGWLHQTKFNKIGCVLKAWCQRYHEFIPWIWVQTKEPGPKLRLTMLTLIETNITSVWYKKRQLRLNQLFHGKKYLCNVVKSSWAWHRIFLLLPWILLSQVEDDRLLF